MPRKRRDIEKFDPLNAVRKMYADDVQRREELQERRERSDQKEAELRSALTQACQKFDLSSFRHLGDVLERYDAKIWVDYLRVLHSRDLMVEEMKGTKRDHLLEIYAIKIPALRLLTAACGESRLKLERELERISEFEECQQFRKDLIDNLWIDYYEPLEEWQLCPHQPTPWITKADLTKAVRGKVKGMSKTGVLRKIESKDLDVMEEHPLNKQSELYRFRHRDPATHAVLLRAVIEFLKNRDKLVSSKLWISQLWDPI